MPNNYERGEAAGIEKGLAACQVLLDKLATARRDSAEWKEQHENLLAMFRNAEQRAANAEAALKLLRSESGPMLYTAAEKLTGGKLRMHIAPPPIWDGKVTFDAECIINGFHVPAGTVWHVILHKEVK